ncbi:MAG: phosphatidylserine decarboxylase [Actinomycetota bacterium]|nr:phosphatidylserine decarboxylase [Actinomycetota bacterium]
MLWALLADLGLVISGRRAGWMASSAALASLLFFRDPERSLDPEGDTVYATADGVIVGVDEISDPWMPDLALRVSTFLSLHNVHVIRSPLAGRVAADEEIKGGFAPAFLGRSQQNLRKRLAIDGNSGRVVVVQIAGMLARKITSWTRLGAGVDAGQRVGLIHLGSRTEVLLSADRFQALVRPGQRVKAGVTPIARAVDHGARS